jgi:signal transduction histidine kinase
MNLLATLKKTLSAPMQGWQRRQDVEGFVARAAAVLFVLGAVAIMGTYAAAQDKGVLIPYNRVANIVASAVLLACAGVCAALPRRLTACLWVAMLSLAAFMQGNLYYTLFVLPPEYSFHIAALSLFIPFVYIATYLLTGFRFASAVAWVHAGVTVAQCSVALFLHRSPSPGVEYFLICVMVAQPLYPLALSMMTLLRNQALVVYGAETKRKAALLSMISHDIRSPLPTILSSIELLELHLKNERERQPLARIRASAARLDAYLRDVIIYNKTDANELQLAAAPFNLGDVIQDVVSAYQHEAQTKGVQLQALVGAEVQAVNGDAERVKQVVTNLISNAVKYTAQGRVVITAQAAPQDPRWVLISVADTGIGIEPAQHDLIWKPFMRTPAARQAGVEGSGLGLAVVRQLVEAMKGSVTVDSAPGKGSVFVVKLPLRGA